MKKEKPQCPECGSLRAWRDGLRYKRDGQCIQRFLCRNCGYRFSDPKIKVNVSRQIREMSNSRLNLFNGRTVGVNISVKKSHNNPALTAGKDIGSHKVTTIGKALNTFGSYSRNHRIRASEGEAKNSVKVVWMEPKSEAVTERGNGKLDEATVKGKLVEFMWYMKRQGYAEGTITRRTQLLKRLMKLGANLWEPEHVKEVIAGQETWSEGTKGIATHAYASFAKMEGISWEPPRYKRLERVPFVPLEKEIDLLISACGKTVSIFLQGLKETGADPGELSVAEWTDVNEESKIIAINHPVKGHNARILTISKEMIARFQLLPKISQRIFQTGVNSMYTNFWMQRKRIARSFNNPRLEKVTFTSIRHWKATTEYHKTKDILHVKRLLGHKSLNSTMVYIDIEKAIYGQLRDEEFTVRVATTLEEDQELVEAGFEYVTERNGAKIYRKRK